MARVRVLAALFLLLPLGVQAAPAPDPPRISEVVADPQTDWTRDGRISPTDEWVELENPGPEAIDLTGWRLLLNDTTPSTQSLAGSLRAGARLVVWNPQGDLNNNGHVALLDASGRTVHEVRFGSWSGATAVSADASDALDEALRLKEGVWARSVATPGEANTDRSLRFHDTWTRREGWTPPKEEASLEAVLLDASGGWARLRYVEDRGDGPRRVAEWSIPGPGQRMTAARPRDSGNQSFTYWWEAEGTSGNLSTRPVEVRVDATPPILPLAPAKVWIGRDGGVHHVGTVADSGVGHAEWRAHLQGGPAPATDWTRNETLGVPNSTRALRLEARDAFGNAAAWAAPVPVEVDEHAPAQIRGLAAAGEGPVSLRWSAAQDLGVGVGHVEVHRNHSEARIWILPDDATNLSDPVSPGTGRLAYRVRAVDGAGNLGPWSEIVVPHSGYQARVVGIRLTKTAWSTGALEARIDFDRKMGQAPRILLEGHPFPPDESRFFANATTFWARWDTPPQVPEGSHALEVEGAAGLDGAPQVVPARRSLLIDQDAPRLELRPGEGRVDSPHLSIRGMDASGATLTWRLLDSRGREADRGGPVEAQATIELPGMGTWRVLAKAVDRLGHRSTEAWDVEYQEAPPSGCPTPAEQERTPPPPGLMLPRTPPVSQAPRETHQQEPPCPAPAAAEVAPLPSVPAPIEAAPLEGRLEEMAEAAAQDPASAPGLPLAPWAWGGAGIAGLATTVGIGGYRRRRRRRSSLAARLRRLRRTEAA